MKNLFLYFVMSLIILFGTTDLLPKQVESNKDRVPANKLYNKLFYQKLFSSDFSFSIKNIQNGRLLNSNSNILAEYGYAEKFLKRVNASQRLGARRVKKGDIRQSTLIRNFFKNKLKLSDVSDTILKNEVKSFISEVNILDKRANKLILRVIDSDKKNGSDILLRHNLVKEIETLESQRRLLPITYWKKIKTLISDQDFEKINNYAENILPAKTKRKQVRLKSFGNLYLSLESDSDLDYDPGNGELFGFASTELTDSGPLPISASGNYMARLGGECGGDCYWTNTYGELVTETGSVLDYDEEFACGDGDTYIYVAGQHQKSNGNDYCLDSEHEIGEGEFQLLTKGSNNFERIGGCTEIGVTEDYDERSECVYVPIEVDPDVTLKEVGFTNDHLITTYPGNLDIDASNTDPVWKSSGSPDYPVAYNKDALPTAFIKVGISPAPLSPKAAKLRVLTQTGIYPLETMDVTITGNEMTINTIDFTNQLESSPRVKKTLYHFDWQISFDDGSTWNSIGESNHTFYWTEANPQTPTFTNTQPKLYDVALDYATQNLLETENTPEKVADKINTAMAADILYKPTISGSSDVLSILTSDPKLAVCISNAVLLRGLMRTVGLDGNIEFHYGGDDTTNQYRNYGQPITINGPNVTYKDVTMQVSRPQLGDNACTSPTEARECIEENPHFTYHATVKAFSKAYDPSYGEIETPNVKFIESPDVNRLPVNGDSHHVFHTQLLLPPAGSYPPVAGVCSHIANTFRTARAQRYSFDNDSQTDLAVYRPSNNQWVIQSSFDNTVSNLNLALGTNDVLTPGDYDGDGKTDASVWRANGDWTVLNSSDSTLTTVNWGVKETGELPVTGDFDGDGFADIASWKSSNGVWKVQYSSNSSIVSFQWGTNGDKPVAGDYDADEKTDYAIWRPSNGTWYIYSSVNQSWITVAWGQNGDIPVPGDYMGLYNEEKYSDFVIWRPSTGNFWILQNKPNTYVYKTIYSGGQSSNDIAAPGDYDGDGFTDVAMWQSNEHRWRIVSSSDNAVEFVQLPNSTSADIPVQSAYIVK